jgi:hypothetical protein
MRRRWLLSAGICALTLLAIRGWSARPAKAATLTHVAAYVGDALPDDGSPAQYRYLRSQSNHWRQVMGLKMSN